MYVNGERPAARRGGFSARGANLRCERAMARPTRERRSGVFLIGVRFKYIENCLKIKLCMVGPTRPVGTLVNKREWKDNESHMPRPGAGFEVGSF